jgi:hypothetical protein
MKNDNVSVCQKGMHFFLVRLFDGILLRCTCPGRVLSNDAGVSFRIADPCYGGSWNRFGG